MWSHKNIIDTSLTIEDESIFVEGLMDSSHKEMNVRVKMIFRHLCDDFEGDIETNRVELINHKSTFFFGDESHQIIVDITEIHRTIIKLWK